MTRRDLLIGAACVGAFGTAEALRPRRSLSLMGDAKLADVVPARFGDWAAEDGGDIVTPKTEGSLADTLYSDTLARNYRGAAGGGPVMLLIAHGDSQSDLLQLHRPESCYPAIGFQITAHRTASLPLRAGAALPIVELTAVAGSRTEDVLYWTRLGEYMPTSAGQQRKDRLATAMQGFVADGVLVRASAIRGAEGDRFGDLRRFAAAMVTAVPARRRAGLIGTTRARALG